MEAVFGSGTLEVVFWKWYFGSGTLSLSSSPHRVEHCPDYQRLPLKAYSSTSCVLVPKKVRLEYQFFGGVGWISFERYSYVEFACPCDDIWLVFGWLTFL